MVDSLDAYAAGGRTSSSVSATQLGPSGGAALGVDFRATSFLALGFELRGALQSFGHQPPMLDARGGYSGARIRDLDCAVARLDGMFLVSP